MKKKNVLLMALSMVLVAVISIGGTLAYLAASDGAVTNTFTFASNLSVDLYETINDEKVQTSYDFEDVVPGTPVDKDANFNMTNASVKSVVFVKIEAEDRSAGDKTGVDMILDMTGTDLTAYGDIDDNGYGEYYIIVDKDDTTEKDIFSKVTAPATADTTLNVLNNVKISISAVQYEGIENVDYDTASEADIVAAAYDAKPAYQA